MKKISLILLAILPFSLAVSDPRSGSYPKEYVYNPQKYNDCLANDTTNGAFIRCLPSDQPKNCSDNVWKELQTMKMPLCLINNGEGMKK
ncbi:hypothetical protein ACFPDQ_02635 [Pseudofrancisella aestuarii]|uniref:DUF3551 domain-containing protein n=1 Tax=Pseudofrancisella aestuarii TaxID=2670347 RepID=A0ABV9TA78_9GAMM|nr:hypothetical protein [Pseudofrancisella aestuarii]